jgi:integration host factor subunit alpha
VPWCCAGKRADPRPSHPHLTAAANALILTGKLSCPYAFSKQQGNVMSDKTLTRMDLSEAVFREVGLSRNESAQLVESLLEHMSDALVRGEQVKISSFGTFSVRDKSARIGRNPKTGEEVPIQPRRVLTFRPSHLMKDRVAAGNKA